MISVNNLTGLLHWFSFGILFVLYLADDDLLMKAVRCLGLLLTTGKTKSSNSDIPFFMKFVSVSDYNWVNSWYAYLFVV